MAAILLMSQALTNTLLRVCFQNGVGAGPHDLGGRQPVSLKIKIAFNRRCASVDVNRRHAFRAAAGIAWFHIGECEPGIFHARRAAKSTRRNILIMSALGKSGPAFPMPGRAKLTPKLPFVARQPRTPD
jgi:hypothetical protein